MTETRSAATDAANPGTLAAILTDEVREREPGALDLLRQLIRTPSISGEEGSHDQPATVAAHLWAGLAAERAVERQADTVAAGRDNVLAIVRGAPDGGVFVLDAHTDTVPAGDPAAWVGRDPFSAADGTVAYLGGNRIRLTVGGKTFERPVRARLGRLWEARSFSEAAIIYGRGAFDNKGPVAVAYLATTALAAALARAGLRLCGTLVSAFVVDEELQMLGTRALAGGPGCWLDRQGLLPEARDENGFRRGISGVALDGSYGFVPIVGHRGVAQLLVRTHGQAAHAATPDLGVNAVTRMAAALHVLDRDRDALAADLAPLFADALLEPATLALGTTVAGGGVERVAATPGGRAVVRQGVNVVPDWCEATIDCRHPRPADRDDATIQARIAAAVARFVRERAGLGDDAVDVSVLGGGPPCAILDHPAGAASDPLIGPILRHGATVSGFQPWIETAPGGTDATVMINDGRIRTLVEYGPAGALAHEPHEFVERDQIAVGALILALTVAEVLGVEPTR